ncbi:repressor [Natrinema saccharevitans]|uniref:Repressor n=2 Tax=Natrialbaceae TaxID=1644061 RepID=A0A1S8AUL7_9EURY|nr:repressor [Natrinema saccharevitans]
MRKRAEWMTRADDEILEYLASETAGTPKVIADALDRSNGYIGVRCRKLASYGLVERPSRGFYVITDAGTAYLEGELDASTLSDDE